MSFECLKSTMSLYLVQETKPGKSANWIVRDFEQIDGDVLRTERNKKLDGALAVAQRSNNNTSLK